MNHEELTPSTRSRYANGMDNGGEIPKQEQPEGASKAEAQTVAQQIQVANERYYQGLQAIIHELDKVGSSMGEAGSSIHNIADVISDRKSQEGVEMKDIDLGEELRRIKKLLVTEKDAGKIRKDAGFVISLGKKWQQDAQDLANRKHDTSLVQDLEKADVPELLIEIDKAEKEGDNAKLQQVAIELAKALERISVVPELKEFGYFSVPRSHEELMEYIAFFEDPKFQPGGEFPLFEKEFIFDDDGNQKYTPAKDENGRLTGEMEPMYNVNVNHNNFLRWIMERQDYFIGQNPFVAINLFQDISVPSINPIQMGYIVNNTRFWASKRWEKMPRASAVELSEAKYNEAKKNGENVAVTPEGKYVRFETKYDYDLATSTPPELGNLRDEVILSLFLTETEHNMDITYFNDGMKNEKPLKEVMEKICNSNFLTRFFPLMMHDPSTSEYHNPGKDRGRNEVLDRLKQDLDLQYQGALGKAQQRALAMYYHLAEANAVANDMEVEGGNPFEMITKGKDGSYTKEFYKSLIRQTLEKKLGDETAGVKDLMEEINKKRTPNGKRYDWEKIHIVDLLLLNQHDLQQALLPLGLTLQDVDNARRKLIEKYNADPKMSQRIQQLQFVARQDTRQQFLRMFEESGKLKFKETMYDDKNHTTRKSGKELYEEFYNGSGYEGLDYFGVKFFASAYDPKATSTQDANIYRHIRYNDDARKIVKQAIADVLIHTEKLDGFEAKYASERSFRRTYFMGISARNDVDSIGHDAASKVFNTIYYRIRQANRAANFYGMEENLLGIRRLGVDMFEGINAKYANESGYNQTLYEMITGITVKSVDKDKNPLEVKFDINKDIGRFELTGNSMRQYFADHLSNALALYDLLSGPGGLDIIAKFQSYDALGRPVFDHKAFKEFMDGIRKQTTYAYDNQGIQYKKLVGGWTQETYAATADNGEIVAKTRVVFGVRTIKDLMFADGVQKMGMYERPDINSGKSIKRGFESDKMARNVLAYLIAMQLKSHQREGRAYWNADAIMQIAEAFRKYGVGILEMANEEALFLRGFFTPEELRVLLATAEIFLWALYSKEYGQDALGGFFGALSESISLILGEVGSSITLKS